MLLYIFVKMRYITLQRFKNDVSTTKIVTLYHNRYGRGQNVKLEKTAVQVLHVVLVNQEGKRARIRVR